MKQYLLFVRLEAGDPWTYADAYCTASLAWHGQLLAMHRGFAARITRTCQTAVDESVIEATS